MLDNYGYKYTLIIFNIYYFFFFHHNSNGCTNAPQYYVIRTLPVLLYPQVICFEFESVSYFYLNVLFTLPSVAKLVIPVDQ